MKKEYEKPFAEKIEFDYQNQVVASGATCCRRFSSNEDTATWDCVTDKIWSGNATFK